ncbi:MAG: hypothetical protein KDA89_06735 [Planctomycetaceae bacterium]|nr:hypothetical protein [Planctomycetaceae bacterium]
MSCSTSVSATSARSSAPDLQLDSPSATDSPDANELTLYHYVRRMVTSANETIDPVVLSEEDEHFRRLTQAKGLTGRRIISIDPRSVQWFFGCRELPPGNQSISFDSRAYIAWDYDPTDPMITRIMAYELARIAQFRRAGGELTFARNYVFDSLSELLDAGCGRQSRLKRLRNGVVRAWCRWWNKSDGENRVPATHVRFPVRNQTTPETPDRLLPNGQSSAR